MEDKITKTKDCVILWGLSNLIATGLTTYIILQVSLQGFLATWLDFALLCFDACAWISHLTNCPNYLCRMTRWNRPSLTRQLKAQFRQRHCRNRSVRIYVRKKPRSTTSRYRI